MDKDKSTVLFAKERKDKILKLLKEQSKITGAELCEMFNVSSVTIRTDLRELESEGKLIRTHGGAMENQKIGYEQLYENKNVEHISQKKMIAQRAAQLVEDGDTIALDTGTTSYEFAKCILMKNSLTVVTNDLKIALYLEEHCESFKIIILGGTLRKGFHCTTGISIHEKSNLNVDKVFMATNGFTLKTGFTTPDLLQAYRKKELIAMAREVIFLMDSSKFGKVSFSGFAAIDDVNKIVTDSRFDNKLKKALQQKNKSLEIIIAK